SLLATRPSPPVVADVVLTNGKIWTVSPAKPQVEALAIWGDRILATGSREEIQSLIGPRTRVLDLQGRRELDRFHDCHVHFLGTGQQLSQVSLKDAGDEAEFGKRLRAFDGRLPRDRWLLGNDWDHDRTFGGKLPTAAILDQYVPERPVF